MRIIYRHLIRKWTKRRWLIFRQMLEKVRFSIDARTVLTSSIAFSIGLQMQPINLTSVLMDNWVFLLFFIILLGCLYALVQFRGDKKKRALLWGKMPGTCAVREMMMKSLAEKLGLRFELMNVNALGGGFPNLKLFQHSTPIGEKIQGRADKIFGGVYGDETPIIRFRNIVKGIVDDSTITIFDHHFSKASPKKSRKPTIGPSRLSWTRPPSVRTRPVPQRLA